MGVDNTSQNFTTGFPTIKLLKKGQVYEFNGRRTKDAILAFVNGGYESAEPAAVPPPRGIFSVFEDIADMVCSLFSLGQPVFLRLISVNFYL